MEEERLSQRHVTQAIPQLHDFSWSNERGQALKFGDSFRDGGAVTIGHILLDRFRGPGGETPFGGIAVSLLRMVHLHIHGVFAAFTRLRGNYRRLFRFICHEQCFCVLLQIKKRFKENAGK